MNSFEQRKARVAATFVSRLRRFKRARPPAWCRLRRLKPAATVLLLSVAFCCFLLLLCGVLGGSELANSAERKSPSPAKPELRIKFSTLAPEGSTWMNVMREFDRDLRKETNGRLGFKIYPGGISGDEKDVIRKIRFGQIHSAGFTGVGLGEILPEIRIFDVPFLFSNYGDVDRVTEGLTPYFKKAFEKKGFVLLAWAEVGFVHYFSKSPVGKPSDMKKLKAWVWQGDPVARAFIKKLGVSAIPLSLPDVLTSLQTGLVDAVYASPLAAVALQWFTKVRYCSREPFCFAAGALLVQKKFFRRLASRDRRILLDLAGKHMDRLRNLTREDNEKSLEVMRKKGVRITPADEPGFQEFRRIGKVVRDELAGSIYSEDLLKKVLDILSPPAEGVGKQ